MRHLDWEELCSLSDEWAVLVSCPERWIDAFALSNMPSNCSGMIRVLRGARCLTRETTLHEIAAALQLPWYFGHNWDALDECITDMSWAPADYYILFFTRSELIMRDDDNNFRILLDVLRDASNWWSLEVDDFSPKRLIPTTFRVVFQCEPEDMLLFIARCNRLQFSIPQVGIDISKK